MFNQSVMAKGSGDNDLKVFGAMIRKSVIASDRKNIREESSQMARCDDNIHNSVTVCHGKKRRQERWCDI